MEEVFDHDYDVDTSNVSFFLNLIVFQFYWSSRSQLNISLIFSKQEDNSGDYDFTHQPDLDARLMNLYNPVK